MVNQKMQITIIAVGKVKEKYLQDGIAEYEKRLRPLLKLRIIEIVEEKRPAHTPASQEIPVKNAEGNRIIAAVAPVIIPDSPRCLRGELVQSGSRPINEKMGDCLRNNITFVIGGDLGLSDSVVSHCQLRLSLSPLTFTHQMARMILLEQIYRAEKINRGEPYHK